MKLRFAIPAGLVDTGATALASFGVQVYAVRTFDTEVLGVYALFFSAYLLASLIPQFLFLYPLEIDSLQLARSDRLGLIRRSRWIFMVTPFFAGAAAVMAWQLTSADVDGSVVAGLGVTSATLAVVAPFYEHLKRMMHISERSMHAASTGAAQLALVMVVLTSMILVDADPVLIPFTALAASQVGAALLGLGLVWRRLVPVRLGVTIGGLVRSGRWLLVSGVVPAAATFVAAALVSHLASAEDLGLAQAAHVAARPVLVVATGLAAVLGFRMMEAGATGDRQSGTRYWQVYASILLVGGIAYAAVAAFDWAGNPIAVIIPRAYEVAGLAAAAIGANLVLSLMKPPRDELIGARLEPWVAAIDSMGASTVVVVALFAGVLNSFAIPLGILAAAVVHSIAYVSTRRALYRRFGAPATGGL